MKKVRIFLLAALSLVALASCEKDEQSNATTKDEQHSLSASLAGWTQAEAAYFSGLVYDNVDSISLSSNSDQTANIQYVSSVWGTATFESVEVKSTSAGYSFSGDGSIAMAGRGGVKDYECTLIGTVSIDYSSFSAVITVPSVMGGLQLTVSQGLAPVSMVIAGSYAGWSSVSSGYFNDMNNNNDTIVIAANDDGTAHVEYRSSTWGKATFANVQAMRTADGYALSEATGSILMSTRGVEATYDAVLSSMTLGQEKTVYSATITVPAVMNGTTILFQNGSAPEDTDELQGE